MTPRTSMKAIGVSVGDAATDRPLMQFDAPVPAPGPSDLRVRVEAVSVNPVDTKVRAGSKTSSDAPRVLGWDAAGVVDEVGSAVSGFQPGDLVYYAGSLLRPGCNSELHLVDHRLAAKKPTSLDFAEAAGLPLTTLTAWEGLFERLGIDPSGAHRGRSLLVIGGAGGVGSMVVQLAKRAGLTVLATASQPEGRAWVQELGADELLDRRQPLRPQVEATGRKFVDFVFNTQSTDAWWDAAADLVAPLGRVIGIVETSAPVKLDALKNKSASFGWEFMFTRSWFETLDMSLQGEILRRVAALVDKGELRSTVRERLGPVTPANLEEAHRRIRSGSTVGKMVLSGWN